jgi:hypothetical protein
MDKSHDKPENPTDLWSKDVELEVENPRVEEDASSQSGRKRNEKGDQTTNLRTILEVVRG